MPRLSVLLILALTACAPAPRSAAAVTFGTRSAGPALRGDALDATLADAVATACRARQSQLDGRLGEIALRVAQTPGPPRSPGLLELHEHARAAGLVEPTPEVALFASESSAKLARAIREHQAGAGGAPPRTHCGAAVVHHGEVLVAALVWSTRVLSLDDVPARIAPGQSVSLEGSLDQGYSAPVLAITRPSGEVERIPMGQGPELDKRLTFHDRGEYRVEILAEGERGVTVAANFPIAVGSAQPVRRDVTTTSASEQTPEAVKAALEALITEERARHGLPPLEPHPEVSAVALAHSQDMAQHQFVAHVSPTHGGPDERAKEAGLQWTLVLENIGRGYSAEEIHLGLMESPGHRDNVLNPDAREVGIGVVAVPEGDRSAFLVTELFTHLVPNLDPKEARKVLLRELALGRKRAGIDAPALDDELMRVAQQAASARVQRPGEPETSFLTATNARVEKRPPGLKKLVALMIVSSDIENVARHDALLAKELGFLGVGVAKQESVAGQPYTVVLLLGER